MAVRALRASRRVIRDKVDPRPDTKALSRAAHQMRGRHRNTAAVTARQLGLGSWALVRCSPVLLHDEWQLQNELILRHLLVRIDFRRTLRIKAQSCSASSC